MLGIEQARRKAHGQKVRQVFVTQSGVLAERVEEYFHNLLQSCVMESRMGEEFEWTAAKRKEKKKTLMDLDEEDNSSSHLPTRFSQLEDKHFPLFLTFHKVPVFLVFLSIFAFILIVISYVGFWKPTSWPSRLIAKHAQ